jgi:hypothetical protein
MKHKFVEDIKKSSTNDIAQFGKLIDKLKVIN